VLLIMEVMTGCLAEEEKEEACVEREFDAFFGCFRHLEVELIRYFLFELWFQ
jgi:hypothetical protein